jgi:hypothetical protein
MADEHTLFLITIVSRFLYVIILKLAKCEA